MSRLTAPLAALLLAAAAAPLSAQSLDSLSVHGYVTQGYGFSDGAQFYGLTKNGSTDFRYAALQFRYRASSANQFVIQLNHRRMGASPITSYESSINLNWAFYERNFTSGSVRLGRIPVPRGIYNELRSVGVALPFYRPPVVFYDEGAYYSETIDGAVGSYRLGGKGDWTLEANAYVGGWNTLVYDTWSAEYSISQARAENAVGTQLWLETPVEGLRVGAAAQRYRLSGWESDQNVAEWQLSGDLTRELGFLRAELNEQRFELDHYLAGYVQLGVNVGSHVTLVGQHEHGRDRDVKYGEGALPTEFDWHKANGVALNYRFSPNLVLKVEHHWQKGIQVEQPALPTEAPRFQTTMTSFSASF